MNIGFQGWFLAQPYTGIGQHCLGLLRALTKEKDLQWVIVTPKPVKIEGIPKKWLHVLKPAWWIFHPGLKKWWWERIQVPRYFAKKKLDWEYYPYPCPLPKKSSHLRAMTVHDLIAWKDVRYYSNRFKVPYYQRARHSLIYVDMLFTVSKTVHDELGIPAAVVLYNGASDLPKKTKHFSYDDALVYLGGYDIRKNVPELVEVVGGLKHAPRLILIGEPLYASRFYPVVPEYPNVYSLGSLPDDEVYSVLKSAKAFIHFSDSEGFNIPLLQAMSVGVPAIVKDLAINREVSGNSALFLPHPASKNSLMKALSDKLLLLEDPAERKKIIAAQKKAAKRFSWQKTARDFLHNLRRYAS